MSIWSSSCCCHLCGTRHNAVHIVWAREWLHVFTRCKQQTADMRVCIYFACVYVLHSGYRVTKADDCAAHGLLASDPSAWRLALGVKCDLSPPCFALWSEDKDVVELPTTLHYLLTTGSTHRPAAVLLIWCKTSCLWHPSSPFLYFQ